jgi:hypothetical protein
MAQFAHHPFEVQVSTGGTLGVMQFVWRYIGDANWSAPIVSSSTGPWLKTIDDVFADLTFAAATYVAGDTCRVDAAGVVTQEVGTSLGGMTAVIFDLPTNACSSVTTEAMFRMRNAIRPPLLTWGDDASMHAGQMVFAVLKRAKGATPTGAGAGDDLLFKAEEIARKFFDDIGKNGRPDSMTDSSTSVDGPLVPVYPYGDTPRGW